MTETSLSATSPRSIPANPWVIQAKAAPYLFLLPFLALFLLFMLYPIGRSLVLSFYNSAGPRERVFVGWSNYLFLLRDWLFWRAVVNTVIYTIAFLAFQIPLSLGLAMLLNNERIRCRNFFRFAFFSSYLVGHVFVAVIFILLFAPRQGLVNDLLGLLLPGGSVEINWRGSAIWAMPAMIIASLWVSVGYGMVYFLAALQAVDPDLYEAAEVDGAGRLSRFWHITLPSIRPMLIFILLVGTIGSFQLFELPYVLFDPPSGPGMSAVTIVMYLYQQGFEAGNIGHAAAVGWVLVLMLFLVTLAQLRITRALKE